MIRRPPSSTLFPSPTLFRSLGRRLAAPRPVPPRPQPDDAVDHHRAAPLGRVRAARAGGQEQRPVRRGDRSEEHTSELQSRQYLVCRLLLEKKKKRNLYLDTC